ncbi:MAG: hypothetical protein FWF66_00750 [Candidatus Bathyarchaeota archaeon]|nr:hypothetical protein [Candidatus Termiticorpusculum sp.]
MSWLKFKLAYATKHRRHGRHTKLSIHDMLLMTPKYWKQYITQQVLQL